MIHAPAQPSGRLRTLLIGLMALALGLFGATLAPLRAHAAPLSIGSFETDEGWTLNYGGKGATFDRSTEAAHSGTHSARIEVDRTGEYTWGGIVRSVTVNSSSLSLWVKSADFGSVNVRMVDSTGQFFHRAYSLGTSKDWTRVDASSPTEGGSWGTSWGGAGDGVWHGPLTQVWVTFEDVVSGSQHPVAFVDDIAADLAASASFLEVRTPATLFETGKASLDLGGTDGAGTWTARDAQGLVRGSGDFAVASGRGHVDLSKLPNGWYSVSLQRQGSAATVVNVGVVPALPAGAFQASSPFAVGTHFANKAAYGYDADVLLPMAKLVGAKHLRDEAYWDWVEKTPGTYDFSAFDGYVNKVAEQGFGLMMIANYGNPLHDDGTTPSSPEGQAAFARYAAQMAKHYQGKIDSLEVWNEFNWIIKNSRCGLTPECYMPLLKATREAVKAVDPNLPVVGPGTAGGWGSDTNDFNEIALTSTDMAKYVDAWTTHPYRHPTRPEPGFDRISKIGDALKAQGSTIPMWLTESGWSTNTSGVSWGEQADYLVRDYALTTANGVGRYYWYDLMDDGHDASQIEHRWGLFTRPEGSIQSVMPKQSAVAMATMVRMVGALGTPVQEQMPTDTYSVRYGDGASSVRVLWAAKATPVSIATTTPITVTDRFGQQNTMVPVSGMVRLVLDGHPVYVSGGAAPTVDSTLPIVSVTGPASVAAGQNAQLTVRVDGTVPGVAQLGSSVTFTVGSKSVTVPVMKGKVSSGQLVLPATDQLGLREVVVQARSAKGTIALLPHQATIVAPWTWQVVPVVDALSPLAGHVELRLTNGTDAPLTVDAASLEVAGATTTVAAPVVVPARGTVAVLSATIDKPTAGGDVPTAASAKLSNGATWSTTSHSGLTVAEPQGQPSTQSTIDLGVDALYGGPAGPLPKLDPADSSGTVWFSWDADRLYVNADITDDVHHADKVAADLWKSDSIQVATSNDLPGANADRSAFGYSLNDSGVQAYRYGGGGEGPMATDGATITREGNVTKYRIGITWADLHLNGLPDRPFSLSVLVNEADAENDRTWWEWGGGIASGGDASSKEFRAIQLMGGQSSATSTPVATRLMANGQPVAGFRPTVTEYTVTTRSKQPVLTVESSDPAAKVALRQATKQGGVATATLTNATGSTTYTVRFVKP